MAEPRSAKRDRGVGEALVGEALGVLPFGAQRFEGLLQPGDLAVRRRLTSTPGSELARHDHQDARVDLGEPRHHAAWPERLPVRDWHLEGWQPPPTRPAVVLDPFCGTGTTVTVARALGRLGIGVDLSHAYCRAARWRTFDPDQAAKALAHTWAERQGGLFDHQGGGR